VRRQWRRSAADTAVVRAACKFHSGQGRFRASEPIGPLLARKKWRPAVWAAGPAVAVTHQMTGDVRAINADAKTFTLEQHRMLRSNKAQTFSVNDPMLLSNLRTGERVTVAYEKQGQQLIAREVHPIVKKK
jgi:Cu/Ag efflux protein CusF